MIDGALECCAASRCMECPLLRVENCITELQKKARSLIRRQRQELDELHAGILALKKAVEEA